MIELTLMTIGIEDHQYTFKKPSSSSYRDKLIVLYEDAYGNMDSFIHGKEEIQQYLTYEQFSKVWSFFYKPKSTYDYRV